MELAAVGISIVALLVSVVHLLWNVFVWHAGGPRVEVEVQQNALEVGNARVEFMTLLARNIGRSPVDVLGCGLMSESDDWIPLPDEPDMPAPELPYRLKPAEQIDWSLLFVDPLREDLQGRGYTGVVQVWGFVTLGTGKRATSRLPLLVAVDLD